MKATALLRGMALGALALLAGGCGRNEEEDGKIILRFATWGGAKEGNEYDKLLDGIYHEFERRNPGIVLREEDTPGDYVAKMSLAYIAHAQPDLMLLDASSAARFIESGMVADLTPRIRADRSLNLDDYYRNTIDVARRGETIYALPNDFTPVVLYYNKRLFDRAGVPYPDGTWNFAKFREAAKRLTGTSPDGSPQYGFSFSSWPGGWVMWMWNAGADHVSPDGRKVTGYLDSPEAVKAAAFLRDVVVVDKSGPSVSQAASMGVDLFASGQAAMTVSGHWSLVGYKAAPKGKDGQPQIRWEDIGVAPMPHETPASRTVMYESGYAIAAQSRHKDAAWKFLRYMTSAEVQAKYQTSGIAVCARKDVAKDRAKFSPLEASFLPIIPSARPPYGSRIEQYEAVEEGMQKAMDRILAGRDPQEAMTSAAHDIDREFAKG